ncbi:ABC-F family ATP-binding cassette domain-containing protein [uncultured Parolsenella sp.]|uniref:ABC-F family ATP-binding cassette domain-containing protein n=1 Tax=uncultured Parolsenella sp. TaxID=2083008 RepID=UPI002657BF18|nr:ABC-F family ATP-binding cassette domain-containing protein [uncultured Parolsenella sp.]
MGILIGCEHLSHEWPGKPVLDDVTIGVNEGDRIGIVGKNGDGKSTLLQLIGHRLEVEQGSVTWRSNISVGMLGQSDDLDDDRPVSYAVVGDTPEYEWASNPETRRIIAELIGDVDWNANVGTLSGGQRRRVDLARLLIGTYDVLLLDEPTNHLDMGAITWLAAHLRHRWATGTGAMLVITHDRWFLDETCESMWEVHDRVVEPFEGGYSAYIQQRAERERMAQASEERRQNILRKELAWLSRGAQARSSKPKFRIEAARALVADVPPMRNPLELKRLAVSRLGKQVFELKQATVAYEGRVVLDHLDWLIGPGDRYGILGENGAGKTTLLRLLDGKLAPTSGRVKIGKSVKLGTLSQHIDLLADKLDWRVRELLGTYRRSYIIGGKEYTPTKLLENLGFDKNELDTPIADLSGGQSRRLALMCVLLDEPNVLILDEPGNDLDTDMLAVMEDLLDTWPGTLLLVSHDRYLMERVTDDQYALIDGQLRHCPGGVDEYLRLIGRNHGDGRVKGKGPAPKAPITAPAQAGREAPAVQAVSGLSSAEEWRLKKQLASIERKMETQRGRIAELEEAMGQVDQTDYVALEKAQANVDAAKAQLDELEGEWLELEETLEG